MDCARKYGRYGQRDATTIAYGTACGPRRSATCNGSRSRSTRDLLNTLAAIGAANATFRSLHDAWADTTTAHGQLILTVLGGLAEFERHLIIARTGEGRKRTKAHGVLFGRPRKLTPHQRREAIARRDTGKETLMDIARSYNFSHSTISRLSTLGASKLGREGPCAG